MSDKNILEADFGGSIPIRVGNFALLFSVMAAAPLCVLPSKDTIEELFFKDQVDGMSTKQNFFATLGLVIVNSALALVIPNIGSAMTLVGSSINPIIGFILPVVLYWPQIKEKSLCSIDKLLAIGNIVFIAVVSTLSLVKFFQDLAAGDA